MDNDEYTNGFISEIISFAINNHSWYELTAVYFALAIPYYFVSKDNSFINFMESIYESRENSTTGMQLGAPIFLLIALLFTVITAFFVSGLYCLFFLKIHEILPKFTSDFHLTKMIIECAFCFLFSFLAMTIGAVTKKREIN
jgi:hypothetical protein